MKKFHLVILTICTLLLSGCKMDLYSNLSEFEANQMLSLLLSNGVDAEKAMDKADALKIVVDKKNFGQSVEILREHGFPRSKYKSVDDLFPAGQLVTSPSQENAKLVFVKEQELNRLLNNIEGVVSSDVVISYDNNKGYAGETASDKIAASVLIKYSPEADLKNFSTQIRDLIYNSIPGVAKNKVTLVMQPVRVTKYVKPSVQHESAVDKQTSVKNESESLLLSFINSHKLILGMVLMLWFVLALAIYFFLRQKRNKSVDE